MVQVQDSIIDDAMTHHDPLTANAHASPVIQLSPIADASSSALVVKVVRALSISLLAAPGGAKYLWFYLRSSLWKFYLLGSTIMAPKWRRMYSISLCLFSCASLFSLSSWYDILRVPINQGSRVSALIREIYQIKTFNLNKLRGASRFTTLRLLGATI